MFVSRADEADDRLSELSAHLRALSPEERWLRTEVRYIRLWRCQGSGFVTRRQITCFKQTSMPYCSALCGSVPTVRSEPWRACDTLLPAHRTTVRSEALHAATSTTEPCLATVSELCWDC